MLSATPFLIVRFIDSDLEMKHMFSISIFILILIRETMTNCDYTNYKENVWHLPQIKTHNFISSPNLYSF